MIEAIMYFGIGFLVATLLGLLFIPLVHNRAVRLTIKRLEASTPMSMVEIRADRDRLRAEFAISTRRLEMKIEELKAKTSTQLAELGKKTTAMNQLKKEQAENKVTNVALEVRDRTCTSGMNNRPSKAATKNPIPKYMIISIMTPRAILSPLPACKRCPDLDTD